MIIKICLLIFFCLYMCMCMWRDGVLFSTILSIFEVSATTYCISFSGKYTTDLFTEEAVNVIRQHNKSQPLFLYLAHLAVHSGNPYAPLQAPSEVVAKFSYIKDEKRRKFAGKQYTGSLYICFTNLNDDLFNWQSLKWALFWTLWESIW